MGIPSETLVSLYRGELVESIHRGHVAVVDSSGRILHHAGDPLYVTYFRSSAKPLQVLPIIQSGAVERFGITTEEVAAMSASHHGEDMHIAAVASILAKIGLSESDLRCGSHQPINSQQAARIIRDGISLSPVFNNCSGKHAGMLAYAVHKGYPTDGYFQRDHPVQVDMWEAVSQVCGLRKERVIRGVDGCGVVVFGMPIANMAYAYARMSRPSSLPAIYREPARLVVEAMLRYPNMIGGTQDFGSKLMRGANGRIFAKGGAEGLFCLGLPELGIGVAVKIEDGGARALPTAVMEVLREIGAADEKMLTAPDTAVERPIQNHRGDAVGRMSACFYLHEFSGALTGCQVGCGEV
ncbi:MAG: asparaginase [Clostridia bacterium]|nr:asparaginase [Clostridia bacterium]